MGKIAQANRSIDLICAKTDEVMLFNSMGKDSPVSYTHLLIKGRVVYDEFKRDKVIVRPLEWEREEGDLWTDADTAQVALYIEKVYKIKNKNDLQMMLDAVIREDIFRRCV